MILQNILVGLVMIGLGTVGLKFNRQIIDFTGRSDTIESHLGATSTFDMFKLFCLFLVILGIFIATGFGSAIWRSIFNFIGPLFGVKH